MIGVIAFVIKGRPFDFAIEWTIGAMNRAIDLARARWTTHSMPTIYAILARQLASLLIVAARDPRGARSSALRCVLRSSAERNYTIVLRNCCSAHCCRFLMANAKSSRPSDIGCPPRNKTHLSLCSAYRSPKAAPRVIHASLVFAVFSLHAKRASRKASVRLPDTTILIMTCTQRAFWGVVTFDTIEKKEKKDTQVSRLVILTNFLDWKSLPFTHVYCPWHTVTWNDYRREN